jgi:hypothetical protein
MKTITLVVGLMVLIASIPYVFADGPGQPDTKIVINQDTLAIEFVKFDSNTPFSITFEKAKDIEHDGKITETVGWAYHVGINCKSIDDGECVKLPPGDYEVTAEATNQGIDYSIEGTMTVPSNKP